MEKSIGSQVLIVSVSRHVGMMTFTIWGDTTSGVCLKQNKNYQSAHKAQLFADYCEYKVVMRFRKIQKLLSAVSESKSECTA
jgi:hypothetical protein